MTFAHGILVRDEEQFPLAPHAPIGGHRVDEGSYKNARLMTCCSTSLDTVSLILS